MKKFIILAAVFIILACGQEKPQRDNPSNQMPEQQETSEQSVNTIEVFGNVKVLNYKNIELGFPVSIDKIHVVEGQYISAGDILISLNIDEFYNEIKIKEHELIIEKLKLLNLEQEYEQNNEELNANYMTLENSIDIARQEMEQLVDEYSEKNELLESRTDPEIQRLKNEIDAAYQELNKAENEYNQKTILFEESVITEQEYKDYLFAYQQKELGAKNLEFQLDSTVLNKTRELEQIQLEIIQKKANLDELRLQLENLDAPEITQIEIQKETCNLMEDEIDYLYDKLGRYYLNNNKIHAELDNGIVYEILCTEGDSVPSENRLLSIIDLDSLYVEANVPEEFIKDIELGNEAFVIPLADDDRKYSGSVTYIGKMAVELHGETIVPVHIKVNDNDGFLLPNFNVDIEIIPDEN